MDDATLKWLLGLVTLISILNQASRWFKGREVDAEQLSKDLGKLDQRVSSELDRHHGAARELRDSLMQVRHDLRDLQHVVKADTAELALRRQWYHDINNRFAALSETLREDFLPADVAELRFREISLQLNELRQRVDGRKRA